MIYIYMTYIYHIHIIYISQMKEQIKAPERIQRKNEEIANLSDAHFKTLVIRNLTELAEFVTS